MPIERYFLDDELATGEVYQLTAGEFHHLSHVVRGRRGQEVELVNGRGRLASATIKEISKDGAKLEVAQQLHVDPYCKRMILVQGIPKSNRLDLILEKGTELGVDEFILFPGDYSLKKDLSSHQLERAMAIIISAMKQCGRLFLPKLTLSPPLKMWERALPGEMYYGDTYPGAKPFEKAWQGCAVNSLPLTFVIGPESGLSNAEEEKLKFLGAQGVKIHSNILRTETAAIAALSLMSHWLM